MGQTVSDRLGARRWLVSEVQLTSAEGDALDPLQVRFGLSPVEAAALTLEVWRKQGRRKPQLGSIVQRLLDSDSAASLPYARSQEFEPDLGAARLAKLGTVRIGGYRVPRLGIGCMRLLSQGGRVRKKEVSALGLPRSPEASRHALLNAVHVSGVRCLDVARGYGPWPGFAEGLLYDWFAPVPKDLVLASKVGYRRTVDAGWAVDLDSAFLRAELESSRRQFRGRVPLMYLVVRSTPTTPVVNRPRQLARALEPLLEAKERGGIGAIGVANVTLDELRALSAAGPIDVVQNRFSLGALRDPARRAVFEHCRARTLPFVTWGMFGEGAGAPHDPKLEAAANHLGVSEGDLTIALMLQLGPNVMPLPGPSRRATLDACVAAACLDVPKGLARDVLGVD